MSGPKESQRIFWMVRLLSVVGLATIIALIWLAGRQIRSVHTEREQLEKKQEQIYQTTEEILRGSSEARTQIIAILDDDALTRKSGAADHLAEMIDQLTVSTTNPTT